MDDNRIEDLSRADVLPNLPNYFHPEDGDPLPAGLVGARIVRFGTLPRTTHGTPDGQPEGGGLVVDYVPEGKKKVRRVVFGFNENGMWVVFEGKTKTALPEAASPPESATSPSTGSRFVAYRDWAGQTDSRNLSMPIDPTGAGP
jgi:hypothetical protein